MGDQLNYASYIQNEYSETLAFLTSIVMVKGTLSINKRVP